MSYMFEFANSICVFVLITSLILNLFPGGVNKKYVKLFVGILLISLILNPIVNWKKSKYEIENIINGYIRGEVNINIDNDIKELESVILERIENE